MRIKVHIDNVELRRMNHKQIGKALRSMGLDTSKDYLVWKDPGVRYSTAYSGEAIEAETIGAA